VNRSGAQIWQRVKLGEVCNLVNGDAYRESDWSAVGVPIVRIQNLNDPDKPFNHWQGTLDDRVVVNSGDVLLAWSGTPGTSFGTHIWERGLAVLNQHIFRVDLDHHRLDSRYAVFAINEQLDEMIGRAHGAVGLRHVTKREVESLEIPLPPLEEQRRIAARLREQLSILAKGRAALEAQLEAAGALPGANLRAVFEGEEAQRWPRHRLEDMTTKIGSGFTPLGGYATYKLSGIPLIRSQNVLMNSFTTDGLAFISKEQDDEMESSRVQSGDVLLNITGASIGRVCVAPRDICPANVNQHVSVIRSNGELEPRFLSFFLSSPGFQKFIWRTQAGATRQALTKQIIENFVVPAPSLEIQRAITKRLDAEFSASTTLRESIEGMLSELEKLPAVLLRTAFSRNGD
jgi:type I restriction enzyme, S subunit